jgi:Flp pilus assembly protein TadG
MNRFKRLIATRFRAYRGDTRGGAAVEIGLMITVMTIPLLNVPDLAIYGAQSMAVSTAAHAGAEAAYRTCNSAQYWPAIVNCPTFSTVIQDAVQSTSLGTNVVETPGSPPAEGYYCTTTAGALVLVSSLSSIVGTAPTNVPSTCSAQTPPTGATWSAPSAAPGDYVQVSVTYTYHPLFPYVSAVSFLAQTLNRTQWIRLD